MKFNININQKAAVEVGLNDLNEAAIFEMLSTSPTWAETVIIDNEVYYWVSRQKVLDELPLMSIKTRDRIYRKLVHFDEIGIISYRKSGKKDCIKITDKGKSLIFEDGKNSVLETDSVSEPKKLGFKAEKHSVSKPTYNNTNIHNNTNDNKKDVSNKTKRFKPPTIDEIKQFINENNLNVDAETFFYHYESNDWKVGRNKMKSWSATLHKWNTTNRNNKNENSGTTNRKHNKKSSGFSYRKRIADAIPDYILDAE